MRSCPRHSRTLAKCLAPSRGHSKTTPQRSAGRAVRSTELVPFSTSDEWYSRHRPVWFRLRRVRERMVVANVQPLADARGSLGCVDLRDMDLGGVDLRCVDLRCVDCGASICGAWIAGRGFVGAWICGAWFCGAWICGAWIAVRGFVGGWVWGSGVWGAVVCRGWECGARI